MFWQGTCRGTLIGIVRNPQDGFFFASYPFLPKIHIRKKILEANFRCTPRPGRARRNSNRYRWFIGACWQHSGLCHRRFGTRVAPGTAQPQRATFVFPLRLWPSFTPQSFP